MKRRREHKVKTPSAEHASENTNGGKPSEEDKRQSVSAQESTREAPPKREEFRSEPEPGIEIGNHGVLAPWFLSPLLADSKLSQDAIAGLGDELVQPVVVETLGTFAGKGDELFTNELPPGQRASELRLVAIAARLSKGLCKLGEQYFSDFVKEIDEICLRCRTGGSDTSLTANWRKAVIQKSAPNLWRNIQSVWMIWLSQLREMSGDKVFGEHLRIEDDPEYLVLKSHEKEMRDTLKRITDRYELPKDLVDRLRPLQGRDIVGRFNPDVPGGFEYFDSREPISPISGGSDTGPSNESRTTADVVALRQRLLAEYKRARGNPSNMQIYEALNSPVHKPEFYQWLNGALSVHSKTTVNFEHFLRTKTRLIPKNADG